LRSGPTAIAVPVWVTPFSFSVRPSMFQKLPEPMVPWNCMHLALVPRLPLLYAPLLGTIAVGLEQIPLQAPDPGVAQVPSAVQVAPDEHVPQEPPQPSLPQVLPVQFGVQEETHKPAVVQLNPVWQLPQLAPQPLSPHCLPVQFGVQPTH
jgi:hypothetical protein